MTNKVKSKEDKFYQALQDVFIGAKIEGKGGFVNLMKIKSNYYRKIEQLLKSDIEKALEVYPSFRDELFDKLYSFFSRYFSESGSIYFNQTPFHNNVYEKVYTEDKDVILFWKTQMLYYVKTDRVFRNLEVEIDGFKFYFDVSNLEHKKANEKRTLIFGLKKVREDKTIEIAVSYSEKGTKTKTEEILKTLKKEGIQMNEEQLERAFRFFERQSEVDFFINKNAKSFLQEQFKLWSYQYFWEGAKEWTADRVNQLQILKDVAFKIIDFIAQFEDELVKIWNKPKFVKNSSYVVTLDRLKDILLIKRILEHKNIAEQIKEWKELGIVEEGFQVQDVFENSLEGERLAKKYEHLPIHTKYFKDLELEILGQFENLDQSLDGWLIKSENYQALNTILPKFKEKVQTIYIDPPFNLDSSDQFIYRTNYKDANWATLLENRLRIAREWLNEKGSIFVRCDYNGNWIVRCLMDNLFGKENFRNEIILKRAGVPQPEQYNLRFNPYTETLFLFSTSELFRLKQIRIPRKQLNQIPMHMPKENKNRVSVIINGEEFFAPKGRHFPSQDYVNQLLAEGRIKIIEKEYIDVRGIKRHKIPYFLPKGFDLIDTNWTEIAGYSSTHGFSTENSEILLKRVIESASNGGNLILDFFLGSGTTTAVAHKLGRKWIGVEMGEHFWTVVLPRMKRVLAYDKSGISKEVKEYQGGGFFKYYELEQYEEALANCKYEDGDLFTAPGRSPYQEYVFLKDEKILKALEIDYENGKVKVNLDELYPNIDIAETLSNLTGKWIKKISDGEVEFEDGTRINTKDLDYKLIKPLIWWE
ncbi:MAG: site-specific DNA-methyltransferase [Patescibacteria group bacterium]|nr:site-specific DNA-methyltransferase [Patescibacteria group bacterium]